MITYFLFILIALMLYDLIRQCFIRDEYLSRKGKFVIVSGCDSGFGKQLAIDLLKNGSNVFAGFYTETGMKLFENECQNLEPSRGTLYSLKLDVTSDKSVEEALKFVKEILRKKNAHLWCLINNAGVFSVYGPDDWCGMSEYMYSINVNTLGVVRMCHAFVPLVKKCRGRIVTMASSAGRLHGLYLAPYATSKFAVEGYMDCLRLELQPFGVSVHILEPGAFKTELLDLNANRQRIEETWNKTSLETKFEYGEDYKNNFEIAWNIGINLVANSNLNWVTQCYTHAIFSKNPKLRYTPGWDAILLFVPLSVFPASIQDRILSMLYYLAPGPKMVPAALHRRKSAHKSRSNSTFECSL
ncbi:unnamed protein product [Caenorhabditis bovis]|uniref:Uncharacterized protein n=1 Tax=Caenorhabditis bovis TaxID=2654633 RepID=A0A8S1E9B5_9PELO|nr:unnamed protein product [Caenorhabditis bovis]